VRLFSNLKFQFSDSPAFLGEANDGNATEATGGICGIPGGSSFITCVRHRSSKWADRGII
jgi:hypothetical protein